MKLIDKRLISKITLVFALVFALSVAVLNLLPFTIVNLPAGTWKLKRSDVIIVLGTPADKYGKPSPTMRARVRTGVKLFKDGYGQYLILTGAAAHNKFVEAAVMAEEARSEGIPNEHIVLEPLAQNTYQNAFNSVEIMRQRGWTSAVVVSSGAHLRRANLIFSHYPITYCMFPSADPAELSIWDRLRFDQREKYFVVADVFSSQGVTLGLKPEQAKKMAEIVQRAEALHQSISR